MTRSWMDGHGHNWMLDQRNSRVWTEQENKLFENALAYVDENSPVRWEKVAEMIPGKSPSDVLSHYRDLVEDVTHIEEGLIPFPGYSSSFMLDWEGGHVYEGFRHGFCGGGGRRAGVRAADHERKKGVPWTEEEHRFFLMGLNKYGKGDWRNISRNFVASRTPTQVASHAQKYFIRQKSGSKDKRRSSIHDITTVNLQEARPSSPSQQLSMHPTSTNAHGTSDQFCNMVDASVGLFSQAPYAINSYVMKSQAQHLHRSALHNSMVGQQMLFQMH